MEERCEIRVEDSTKHVLKMIYEAMKPYIHIYIRRPLRTSSVRKIFESNLPTSNLPTYQPTYQPANLQPTNLQTYKPTYLPTSQPSRCCASYPNIQPHRPPTLAFDIFYKESSLAVRYPIIPHGIQPDKPPNSVCYGESSWAFRSTIASSLTSSDLGFLSFLQ